MADMALSADNLSFEELIEMDIIEFESYLKSVVEEYNL